MLSNFATDYPFSQFLETTVSRYEQLILSKLIPKRTTMTIFSFSSRFFSALSICALIMAATPTLAEVATEMDTFSTTIEFEGRDTPFTVRQLEIIATEFETLYNALNDDYSLFFVTVTAEEDEDEDEDEENDNSRRALDRYRRRRRLRWRMRGGQRCIVCRDPRINSDRRVLRGESDSRQMMVSYDDDEFLSKFGKQLGEIFEDISLVV